MGRSFKIIRTDISEIGMETIAVIEHLDILDNIVRGISPSWVRVVIGPLCLQGPKESFRHCVVPTITLSGHTADHAILGQYPLIGVAGILTPSV